MTTSECIEMNAVNDDVTNIEVTDTFMCMCVCVGVHGQACDVSGQEHRCRCGLLAQKVINCMCLHHMLLLLTMRIIFNPQFYIENIIIQINCQ